MVHGSNLPFQGILTMPKVRGRFLDQLMANERRMMAEG
jgi:hypothetical protein